MCVRVDISLCARDVPQAPQSPQFLRFHARTTVIFLRSHEPDRCLASSSGQFAITLAYALIEGLRKRFSCRKRMHAYFHSTSIFVEASCVACKDKRLGERPKSR